MTRLDLKASEYFGALTRHQHACRAQMTAIGFKTVAGRPTETLGITFFVKRKLPRRGQKRVLANGAKPIPKRIQFAKADFATDVIEVGDFDYGIRFHAARSKPAVSRPWLGPGTAIRSGTQTGRVTCLLQSVPGAPLYVMTAGHVTGGVGSPIDSGNFSVGNVEQVYPPIQDELVYPFWDQPNGYFDLDFAMARVAVPAGWNVYSQYAPFGVKVGTTYSPMSDSLSSMSKAYIGLQVASSSATNATAACVAKIDYVFPYYIDSFGRALTYSFLASPLQGSPGIPGESGKAWVVANQPSALVGLHVGIWQERWSIISDCNPILRMTRMQIAV
jgi:hypothetical protein